MKISNPKKFTSITNEIFKDVIEKQSRLLSVGDVIRLFATTDSDTASDWHLTKADEDEWVKYSFDGGASWILKFKYKNQLLVPITNDLILGASFTDLQDLINHNSNNEKLKSGYEHVFDFTEYTEDYFALLKKSSVLSFLAVTGDEDDETYTNLPNFRYKFTTDKKLHVVFLDNLPLDTKRIKVSCQLDGSQSLALSLPNATWTNADMSSVE